MPTRTFRPDQRHTPTPTDIYRSGQRSNSITSTTLSRKSMSRRPQLNQNRSYRSDTALIVQRSGKKSGKIPLIWARQFNASNLYSLAAAGDGALEWLGTMDTG